MKTRYYVYRADSCYDPSVWETQIGATESAVTLSRLDNKAYRVVKVQEIPLFTVTATSEGDPQ